MFLVALPFPRNQAQNFTVWAPGRDGASVAAPATKVSFIKKPSLFQLRFNLKIVSGLRSTSWTSQGLKLG